MPTVAEWLVFLGGTAVFAVLPGPGTRRVLARALRDGRSAGCRFAVAKALCAMAPVTAVSFVLPYCVPAGHGRPLVFLLLGLIVVAVGLVADVVLAVSAGTLRVRLAARPGQPDRPRSVAGVATIGAGTALLVADRD
jgi:threonine/homoserine/homoserine lactone efflux protein